MWMNTHDQYGLVARLLHWFIFMVVAGMLLGGIALSLLPPGGFRSFVVAGHKSFGVIVLFFVLVRLVWRNSNPTPKALGAEPVLNYSAHLVHVILYVLLILQPFSGILMSQAYGHPVAVFGLFTLPSLVWQSPSAGAFFNDVHSATAALLSIAIAIHAAAAVKHHYIDGDRTLMRMIKGR